MIAYKTEWLEIIGMVQESMFNYPKSKNEQTETLQQLCYNFDQDQHTKRL